MLLESKKYLEDIRYAIEAIHQFVSGKVFTDYSTDRLLQSGVERQFEIIGEALSRLLKVDNNRAPSKSHRVRNHPNIDFDNQMTTLDRDPINLISIVNIASERKRIERRSDRNHRW